MVWGSVGLCASVSDPSVSLGMKVEVLGDDLGARRMKCVRIWDDNWAYGTVKVVGAGTFAFVLRVETGNHSGVTVGGALTRLAGP